MRLIGRIARLAAWATGGLIAGLALGVAFLLAGINTAPGRHLIERLAPRLTGGEVAVAGLRGHLPGRVRAAQVEIRDVRGTWMRVDGLRIAWSPLRLLFGTAKVERLAASRVAMLRLPEASGGSGMALRILVERLSIRRLDLAAAVAGTPIALELSGRLRRDSAQQASLALVAHQLGGSGRYKLSATISPDAIGGQIEAAEPARGPLAGLIGGPDLGPLSFTASLAGPRAAEHMRLALTAERLRGAAKGAVDLLHRTLNLDVTARAPTMAPRGDLSWRSAAFDAHISGPFTRPVGTGHLEVEGIAASGGTIERLVADIRGSGGALGMTASVTGLRPPGLPLHLLATAPLEFRAKARLDDPLHPVSFSVSHPLFTITGHTDVARSRQVAGSLEATLPSLAPWALAGGLDVQGHARFKADFSIGNKTNRLTADGSLSVTGGFPAAVGLLGKNAKLTLAAAVRGRGVEVERATIAGKALKATARGSERGGVLAVIWQFAISDLSRLDRNLTGALKVKGRLDGPKTKLGLVAQASGDIAGAGLPKIPVALSMRAQDLPGAPAAQVTAKSRLAGAPLQIVATGTRSADGTLHLSLAHARWKSAEVRGMLTLAPGAPLPLGNLRLRVTDLAQLQAFIHEPLGGGLDAQIDLLLPKGAPRATVKMDVHHLELSGRDVANATLDGTIVDPLREPRLAFRLALDGIAANGISGAARLEATGPINALKLRLSSDLRTPKGPARLSAAALLDASRRALRIGALEASSGGETARLLAPAEVEFAKGLAIERARLGIGKAVLAVAGRVSPQLGLTVSLRNAGPALVKPFLPDLQAEGVLALEARLNGSLEQPGGTIQVTGRGLRLRGGAANGMPAADLTASADLHGTTARVAAQVTAAAARFRIAGTAPLKVGGPLDLRMGGTIDLAVIDSVLAASGRSLRGKLTLDGAITGAFAAPRVTGSAHLVKGDFQDFVRSVHISDMAGSVEAGSDGLRIRQLTGHAGPGQVSVSGTVGAFAPGMPVDLVIVAHDARPLASDLLTADIDGNVTVRGKLAGRLVLGGEVRVRRADIGIPDAFPPSVAVLQVRRPGQKAPRPPEGGPVFGLALTIDAPERVFVRGHGLDAELGGRLRLAGMSTAPVITGGLDLRHGNFNLAGQALTFTSGKITFTGGGLANKLDPSLDFVAESAANGINATLAVTGYADAPQITLTSTPPLPQDEVLARLLFGQSVAQLSPFQLAAIAGGLATLGGSGGNPLARLRNSLGLDQLSVGAASSTGGAAATAGKYVANGVYVGATQGTTGSTQAQVRVDLTKHLKVQSTLGTGNGTPATGITPQNDPGSSIGLTYQFEY